MKTNFPIPEKYQFQKYDSPKIGLFELETDPGEYKLGIGWLQQIKEEIIIGETKDSFVVKLLKSENGYWVGDKVIKEKITIPHGIHKSRLIDWTGGQLALF